VSGVDVAMGFITILMVATVIVVTGISMGLAVGFAMRIIDYFDRKP
jgi:hypothetical protein